MEGSQAIMKKEQSQSVYKLYLYVKDGQSQNNTAYYKYFQLLSYLQGFATQILDDLHEVSLHSMFTHSPPAPYL